MSSRKNSPDYQDDHDVPSPKSSSSKIVYSMQLGRFEVFKAQDQENGYFDFALEIDGKKIYVHKYFLATASETLKAMISDRWNKSKDGAIKIENPDYSYESFYEFLCFIYSGTCKLTKENVFVLTDMAEFYGIQFLKESCDEFLPNININVENIEQMVEFSFKYSLPSFSSALKKSANANLKQLISAEYFVNCSKVFIEFLLASITDKDEAFFSAFCKWVQHQVTAKKLESVNGESDINTEEWIKTEFKDLSGHFKFSPSSFKFVKEFILDKRSLFSTPELYHFLVRCQKSDGEHEECFKTLYELAKTEVTQKLQPISEDNINVAIKKELIQVIPSVNFREMEFNFLMDFVVKNGILFEGEVRRSLQVCMNIYHGNCIYGSFIDVFGINKCFSPNEDIDPPQTWNQLQCSDKKFIIPSAPSTVMKMKCVEWYLCLDKDGYLMAKHHTVIQRSDYLIAEMKTGSGAEFSFNTKGRVAIYTCYTKK